MSNKEVNTGKGNEGVEALKTAENVALIREHYKYDLILLEMAR